MEWLAWGLKSCRALMFMLARVMNGVVAIVGKCSYWWSF